MKDGKAPGADSISASLLQAEKSKNMLEDWNIGLIVRRKKQGDPSHCNNWRGITLSSLTGKVFSKMILELFTGNLGKGYY